MKRTLNKSGVKDVVCTTRDKRVADLEIPFLLLLGGIGIRFLSFLLFWPGRKTVRAHKDLEIECSVEGGNRRWELIGLFFKLRSPRRQKSPEKRVV